MKLASGLVVVAFLCSAALASEPLRRTLTFDQRVAAQKAIEQVFWDHRVWPKENPQPKPPLSTVMSDDSIASKVEDYLRKSSALESWWQRPITSAQLQGELDRMAKGTRDPQVLRELFAALGNDPYLLAETLARATLSDRLIRNWYANDTRFHAWVRATAEAALASCARVECMSSMGGEYHQTSLMPSASDESRGDERSGGSVVRLDSKEWKAERDRLAARPWSGLNETSESFAISALLSETADAITTASVVWSKQPFDAWWSAHRAAQSPQLAELSGSFVLPETPSTGCTVDTWSSSGPSSPDPRTQHAGVWTGAEMIVWGGYTGTDGGDHLNSGARYNPATDTWAVMPVTAATPSKRRYFSAVWTGTEMIVWGGSTHPDGGVVNSGGRYNPATDSWTATASGAPTARHLHCAVWTGTEMIIWGGGQSNGLTNTGGRYNPTTNTWIATPTGANVPSARYYPKAVWTGSEMIVWGGIDTSSDYVNTGGRYKPSTNGWVPTSTVGAAAGRRTHTALWTGSEMIVWGGLSPGTFTGRTNTGGRYNPVTDAWTATSLGANVPSIRSEHTAVWTGSQMIIWGGENSAVYVNTGGRYDPSTDTWTATSTGANVPAARELHTAVWTGAEMIVWGGGGFYSTLSSGGRYDPTTDSWVATSTGTNVPSARHNHTAFWTGAEMIVWGGLSGGTFSAPERTGVNSGGRYVPSTDSWFPTSIGANVPIPRGYHSAIWTGREMIVWGGSDSNGQYRQSGGRYNPLTDSWAPTSDALAPPDRGHHTAVWTGREMIIWGGTNGSSEIAGFLTSGGRYNPSTNSWVATSIGANVPEGRQDHTAVWTGGQMIVWGGYQYQFGDRYLGTGGRYDPGSDTWTATSQGGASPPGRVGHTAVWTGTEMIVWGGDYGAGYFSSGGRYDPSADTWATTSNAPSARDNHAAVWTGAEMFVWGGYNGSSFLNSGGRYNPSTNSWIVTSIGLSVPEPREFLTAVATGPEVIVWGGWPLTSTGGRYCACPNGRLVYRDADGDGFGIAGVATSSCDGSLPAGYVANNADCDDGDPNINPGGTEVCNSKDDDCDGAVDNQTIPCTDGNACTVGDDCSAGVCLGTPVGCNDNNPCTDDSCDTATGNCVYTNDDTNACSDGNLCMQTDACLAGSCQGTNPVDCNAACPSGFTEVGGLCRHTYDIGVSLLDNLGASCDGTGTNRYNSCNSQNYGFHWNDLGSSFAALTRIDVQFESGLSCGGASSIVTLNGAPAGTFSPVGGCQCASLHGTIAIPNLDSAAYVVGGFNAISIDPTGSCEGLSKGSSVGNNFARVTVTYAPYSRACQVGACVPATGTCSFSNAPDGTACDDACTSGGVCAGGTCLAGSPVVCDDNDLCTNDSCNPTFGCVFTGCNDHNACSGTETCDPATGCVAGTPLNCDDGNPCTDDSCMPSTGCQHSFISGACDDGDACTLGDQCSSGICVGGAPIDCSDGNICTDDACDVANGCLHVNNSEACDDGNLCTLSDICGGGTCTAGPAVVCNDANPCTTDTCYPNVGCVSSSNADPCTDGNACTIGDVCADGWCHSGAPITAPPEVQNVTTAADKSTYSWSAAAFATRYDVTRGSTGAFPIGPGGGDEVCFDNLASTTLVDPAIPNPDTGFWYLSRGENDCGKGTYGTQSNGLPRTTTTCP